VTDKQEFDLDRALNTGERPTDPELASLYDSAAGLKDALPADAPGARMHKAMFVEGVGARRRRATPMRFLVPVLACMLLLAAGVTILGRNTEPGDDLYSIRGALQAVGLADTPAEEAETCLADANRYLNRASALVDSNPEEARRLTFAAIAELARARRLMGEDGSASAMSLIATLEDRAVNLLVQLESPPAAAPRDDSGDDNSGPGSGDDDSSGPGGGDDSGEDDNSGPGGDDDSGDDRSGRDGGGDDDRSGSGGGGGDDSDDNSGSGGDDDNDGSGGGGDDSSGSGGGGDDSSGSGGDDKSGSDDD
jgi:hypothetical protein